MNIRHLTYRLITEAKATDYEIVLVNLVFDTEARELFLRETTKYKQHLYITDIDEYERLMSERALVFNSDGTVELPDGSSVKQRGWVNNYSLLRYIEKFDVFHYYQHLHYLPVQSMLNQLRLLQSGVNLTNLNDDYLLFNCIKAMDYFWD